MVLIPVLDYLVVEDAEPVTRQCCHNDPVALMLIAHQTGLLHLFSYEFLVAMRVDEARDEARSAH